METSPRRPEAAECAARDPAAVCTLTPAASAERTAWIRREILPHALGTEPLADGLALELAAAPGLAGTVDRWIALERECCAELVFERTASARPGRLRVELRGVDPDAPLVRSFRAAADAAAAGAPGRRRLAAAAGLGALAGLVVCCALPLAAAVLLGAGAGGALAWLDAPLPLAGAAALGGVLAGARLGRPRARRGPAARRSPCGPAC